MTNPQRSTTVISEAVGDGLGVFDPQRNQSYVLNATSALVFQHADGQTTPDQLTEILRQKFNVPANQANKLMWLALDELQKANLLQGMFTTTQAPRPLLSRRQVLGGLAAVGLSLALLPLVAPVVVRAAAPVVSQRAARSPALSSATLTANRDSILLPSQPNQNEGANPVLHLEINRRDVVGFDLTGVDVSTVASAQLVLTINSHVPPFLWGPAGQPVGVHRLLETWVEGNGKEVGLPRGQSTRGSGPGVTWNCPIDAAIQNHQPDGAQWNGGNFVATPTSSVVHTNGMSGDVVWDVTVDVQAGADSWLLKDTGNPGNVRYHAKDAGNPAVAPRLLLEFSPPPTPTATPTVPPTATATETPIPTATATNTPIAVPTPTTTYSP